MKKVFLFEIKKLLVPLSVYLAIMTIIGFTVMLVSFDLNWASFAVLYGVFLLLLMATIIYLSFSYNKKRISADMTYSLPVTKKELFLGKYLASLASIFSLAIVYFLICLIIMGMANLNGLFKYSVRYMEFSDQLGLFVLGCLIHLFITIPIFNFLLLFYYKANTVLDGILFVGFGLAILLLCTQFIIQISGYSRILFLLEMFVAAPQSLLPSSWRIVSQSDYIMYFSVFITYVILGYLIFGYLWWFFKKDCSVRTQGLCDGIFGYRVFLPLVGGLLPFVLAIPDRWEIFKPIWFILTAVGLFIGYCIYHRSIKFNKESYIVFGCTLVVDFIFLVMSFG